MQQFLKGAAVGCAEHRDPPALRFQHRRHILGKVQLVRRQDLGAHGGQQSQQPRPLRYAGKHVRPIPQPEGVAALPADFKALVHHPHPMGGRPRETVGDEANDVPEQGGLAAARRRVQQGGAKPSSLQELRQYPCPAAHHGPQDADAEARHRGGSAGFGGDPPGDAHPTAAAQRDKPLLYLLLPGVSGVAAEGGEQLFLLPLPQHGPPVGRIEKPASRGRDHLHGLIQSEAYLLNIREEKRRQRLPHILRQQGQKPGFPIHSFFHGPLYDLSTLPMCM